MNPKDAKIRRLRIYNRYLELKAQKYSITRAAERMGIGRLDLAKQLQLIRKYGEEHEAEQLAKKAS